MYLHLSETTIKTILGTILQNQSKIFPYIQYLAYLQLIVINLFKNFFSVFGKSQLNPVISFPPGNLKRLTIDQS